MSAEQSVTSVNGLPTRYGRTSVTAHSTDIQSLAVASRRASVDDYRLLAKARIGSAPYFSCIRAAPAPAALASMNGLSHIGWARITKETKADLRDRKAWRLGCAICL